LGENRAAAVGEKVSAGIFGGSCLTSADIFLFAIIILEL
jgi:hypothetical protein